MAADAYAQLREPVPVDHADLAIHAGKGCPASSSPGSATPSARHGILAMAAGFAKRCATVITALGYADASEAQVFQGTCATELRGTSWLRLRPHPHP